MPKPETTNAKTIIFCLATLLGLFFAYQLRVLIINLLLALTLASAICPLAEKLEAKRISRIVTVLGVYATVALLYAAVAAFLAPAIWEQAVQLYQQLPAYMANFLEWYRQLVALAGENAQAVNFDIGDVRAVVIKLVHQTLDVTAGLVGVMLNGILVLFLTAYFVVEANIIWPELLKWVPPNKREHVSQLIRPLSSRMGGYVRGQILVSLAVASFLAVGLTLLGVKYSLVLGVLAGLLNLMPFVGSMLTAAFSILVAANQSLVLGALTLGLFALEQWFESNVIVPQLLGKQVELHPILVLFAILIGATLMGLPGALIAVPVTSAGIFLAQEFYLKPLNQQSPEPASES